MAYDYERDLRSKSTSVEIDLGLKAYMNKVYSFMAVGLALTGAIAHLTSTLAFNFTTNTYTTSVQLDVANLGGTSTFAPGETLSWTNSGLPAAYQSCTGIIVYWDSSNTRLWLRNMSHPLSFEVSGDTNFTSSGGGTCSAGPTYAGTGGTAGNSGRVRYYDARRGVIYFQNYEFKNNLDYTQIGDFTNEHRETSNNNLNRSLARLWRPVATTATKQLQPQQQPRQPYRHQRKPHQQPQQPQQNQQWQPHLQQ